MSIHKRTKHAVNNKLISIILVALVVKTGLIFSGMEVSRMNPDEEKNFQIALNYQQGNGYTLFDENKRTYIPTAFHGSFPVFIYGFLLETEIEKESWIAFIHVVSVLLFALSTLYFYRLSRFFIDREEYVLLATATYCFYPSMLYYIGAVFLYENLALPILVMLVYKLLRSYRNGLVLSDFFLIPGAITISCLLRPQTIAIYSLILVVYAFMMARRQSFKWMSLMLITVLMMFVAHTPIFLKNEKIFGEPILSTQSGFEFLQGHNPTARGGWMGNWRDSTSVLHRFVQSNIENISELNEWKEGEARKQLAIDWIVEHPLDEIKLSIRKLAIYFVPGNYDSLPGANVWNPINLMVHMLFVAAVIWSFIRKSITADKIFLFAPIAASIILTLVFFVGYRWRYYAEPFMIIFSWYFIGALVTYLEERKQRYRKLKTTSSVNSAKLET